MTLAEALRGAASRLREAAIEDPELEAEVLLRHALGISREALFARLQDTLAEPPQATFEALIERRLAHEPAAYITGHGEFFDLDLACTPAALIPRPETELLVELALAWVKAQGSGAKEPWVVDVGTGNGAIAVALAVHAREAHVVAVDASRPALLLAQQNAAAHAVAERIAFVQGSLLNPCRGQFDVIVANLPYVP
ncbi:MAG: HemK/PrmC family methyltransferase, partial [Dehalococcoidia bacterium]|nr:HemK/PrmC family methyltransferase [Dehalococcoidia bacterium]